jgi:glutathione S-transferase
MLKLYYAPGSCARASHIALHEAGADFELKLVDFASAEQRAPTYHAVNPKGRVPALGTDQGVLTETPAILTYIAQTHPQARLAPIDDPFTYARMQAVNAYLCATVHVAHAHSRRSERWADTAEAIAEMKRKAPTVMADCFQMIESNLLVGPWALGDIYSTADPYLFTITQWLPFHDIDVKRYPKVHAHMTRMLERPAVTRTISIESAASA